MQMQMALVALASTAMLLLSSTTALADPDKDESRGQEKRQVRGSEIHGERKYEDKDGGQYKHKDRRGKDEYKGDGKLPSRSWFHDHGYANLGLPDGHLPPPGECRIWYPARPAGQQPPPGKCGALSRQVPAGAWLMRRPDGQPQQVDVTVYDQQLPGVALSVGIFDARTGSFIRIDGAKP